MVRINLNKKYILNKIVLSGLFVEEAVGTAENLNSFVRVKINLVSISLPISLHWLAGGQFEGKATREFGSFPYRHSADP